MVLLFAYQLFPFDDLFKNDRKTHLMGWGELNHIGSSRKITKPFEEFSRKTFKTTVNPQLLT